MLDLCVSYIGITNDYVDIVIGYCTRLTLAWDSGEQTIINKTDAETERRLIHMEAAHHIKT